MFALMGSKGANVGEGSADHPPTGVYSFWTAHFPGPTVLVDLSWLASDISDSGTYRTEGSPQEETG